MTIKMSTEKNITHISLKFSRRNEGPFPQGWFHIYGERGQGLNAICLAQIKAGNVDIARLTAQMFAQTYSIGLVDFTTQGNFDSGPNK